MKVQVQASCHLCIEVHSVQLGGGGGEIEVVQGVQDQNFHFNGELS